MHYYKTMRGDHRELWENREALDKYLACLKEYWDEEKQQWKESRNVVDINVVDTLQPIDDKTIRESVN